MYLFFAYIVRTFFKLLFGKGIIVIFLVIAAMYSKTFEFLLSWIIEFFWELFFYLSYLLAKGLEAYFVDWTAWAMSYMDTILLQFPPEFRVWFVFFRVREVLAFAVPILVFAKVYKWIIFKPPGA